MAAPSELFDEWLSEKLRNLGIDHDVFGTYIRSILDGGETEVEKREALEGILSDVLGNDITDLCNEIFLKWSNSCFPMANTHNGSTESNMFDMDAKIASIMEMQAQPVTKDRNLTTEEKQIREAILAHYSHVSDEELNDIDDPGGADGSYAGTTTLLTRNTNSEVVVQAEKEKRDKSKAEAEKKKALDKLNREKQKHQQQERKEKERKRTQKGERKR